MSTAMAEARPLTEGELADRWQVHPTTLRRWRSERGQTGIEVGPAFIKIGSSVRYRMVDILAFEAEQVR